MQYNIEVLHWILVKMVSDDVFGGFVWTVLSNSSVDKNDHYKKSLITK